MKYQFLFLFFFKFCLNDNSKTDFVEILKKLIKNEQLKKELKNPENIRNLTEGLLYKEN